MHKKKQLIKYAIYKLMKNNLVNKSMKHLLMDKY